MRRCPYRREEIKNPDGSVTVSEELGKCYERECPFYDWDAGISIGGRAYCKRVQQELEILKQPTKFFDF